MTGYSNDLEWDLTWWKASRKAILTYRILAFLYWLVMFIVSLARFGHIGLFFVYLSHISQLLILLFYLVAMLTARGCLNKSKKIAAQGQMNGTGTKRSMRWHAWVTLVLFTIAFDFALMVTSVYPMEENIEDLDFISFNKHILNTVLMILELFLNRFPVNFWHFPFATLMAAAYGVVLTTLHFTGVNSALYKSFDFARTPIRAWLLSGASILVAPQIAQCIMCLCNVAKKLAWRKFYGGKLQEMDAEMQLKEIRTDSTTNALFK